MTEESGTTYLKSARDSFDADWARIYRTHDELEGGADSPFRHYGDLLEALSSSFDRPIDVLDAGCGTGRYFHRLRNVDRLVGMDLSAAMLQQARNPLHADQVQARRIEFACGDLLGLGLPAASFDMIYSVGVYGEYAPLDVALVREFQRLLRPGGLLFVTAVESSSRVSEPENVRPSLPLRIVRKLFPRLPVGVRLLLNRRLSPFYTTKSALEQAFRESAFTDVDIAPYVHRWGWKGTHWDCTARAR
jgi:SAM-dependent methyltransferase